MPQDTDSQLHLMAGVDEMFDGDVTDEELESMLDEMRDMFSHRKPLAD